MPAKEHIYRHTTVSRFQLTGDPGEKPFDFKNNIMRISEGTDEATDRRNERFLDLVGSLHPRDRAQIKRINPEAAKNLEQSLGPRVSRTALDTSQIRTGVKGPDGQQMMSQAQIDEIAEQQREADQRQESLDQAALDEAGKLIAEGAGGESEEARLARVQEAEKLAAEAGEIDKSAEVEATQQATSGPTGAAPKAGIQPIKK